MQNDSGHLNNIEHSKCSESVYDTQITGTQTNPEDKKEKIDCPDLMMNFYALYIGMGGIPWTLTEMLKISCIFMKAKLF